MKEEWYEPSPRAKRRAEAFFATPEGKIALERFENRDHIVLEQRIREGLVLPPDEMAIHERWRARHPELFTNPHK